MSFEERKRQSRMARPEERWKRHSEQSFSRRQMNGKPSEKARSMPLSQELEKIRLKHPDDVEVELDDEARSLLGKRIHRYNSRRGQPLPELDRSDPIVEKLKARMDEWMRDKGLKLPGSDDK